MTDEQKKELERYVRANVSFFEKRYDYALDKVGKWRCPLSFADEELWDDITYFAEWWAVDTDYLNYYFEGNADTQDLYDTDLYEQLEQIFE